MRLLAFTACLFLIPNTQAATLKIVGACLAEPVVASEFPVKPGDSVGSWSLRAFGILDIEFVGTAAGLNSILGTPTGTQATETLSPTEARFYGWCYHVDGSEPALMPDQYLLSGSETILWFYAFSHLKDGQWLSYCEPAHTVRPKALCEDLPRRLAR